MKKERRIKLISITILLVLFFQYISVVLPFIEVQAAEIATEDSNGLRWKYTLNENNEATITIFNGNSSDLGETLEIPSELDGYKVVEVKGRYYQYSQDPYLSVLYYTTNNTRVKKLRLPDSLKTIGMCAFATLTNLEEVTYYNEDGEEAEGNVENIGFAAFYKCTSLKEITIPETVTSLPNIIFCECTALTTVNIPQSLTKIGNSAFSNCKSLNNVILPESVTIIEESAFSNCTSLTSIILPENVTNIKWNTFSECINLEKIEISDNVTSIDDSAFYKCEKLTIYGSGNEESEIYKYAQQKNIKYVGNIEVKCNDINLYNKLKTAIASEKIKNINDEEKSIYINYKDLETIEELDLSNYSISDITGLEKFTNLKRLNLSNNNIDDITILENLELEEIDLRNQTIEKEIHGDITNLPNILEESTKTEFGRGILDTTTNASIRQNKIEVNSKNIRSNDIIEATVDGGTMDGTKCTFKVLEGVTANYKLEVNELEVKVYRNEEELTDATLYYSVNGSEYTKYTGKISLDEGDNEIKVKFFDQEVINEILPIDIATLAIRKNGKVYIYDMSKYQKKYSLTGEIFQDYEDAIENEDAETIFVKIGNNVPKEIAIKNIDENYEIHDTQIGNDVLSNNSKLYNTTYAIRENGIVKIINKYEIVASGYEKLEYSFDDTENFENKIWNIYPSSGIENITADVIYMRKTNLQYNDNSYHYTYKIVNKDELSEVLGVYEEGENSHIFEQIKTDTIQEDSDYERMLIISDENKIEKINKNEILDVTEVAGKAFVLKGDGKVYERGSSYADLKQIEGTYNFKQIENIYALDNSNNIWKCEYDYDNNKYTYKKYNYTAVNQIEKIAYTKINGVCCLYVLYENGDIETIENDDRLSSNAIDIEADLNNLYILKYNSVIHNNRTIDIRGITEKGEIPLKINKKGGILTDKGNYYELNAEQIYSSEPNETKVLKTGDYTYEKDDKNVYYLKDCQKINRKMNSIVIEKDESKLKEGIVKIKLQVSENIDTIKLPNGETTNEKNYIYEVSENGQYVFEFKDIDEYSTMRIIHVNSIQSRKDTKVPEVEVLNNKIYLKSDEPIEYSIDGENWNTYTQEIEYTGTTYTRIKNENYECSILKIVIDENGKATIENTEKREIQGKILSNSIGENTYVHNLKEVRYEKTPEYSEENNTSDSSQNKTFFDYISEIADNIIYSFSSTDGEYAGCHFSDTVTDITYKDMDNNIVTVENRDVNINSITENEDNIDYGIIVKEYSQGENNPSPYDDGIGYSVGGSINNSGYLYNVGNIDDGSYIYDPYDPYDPQNPYVPYEPTSYDPYNVSSDVQITKKYAYITSNGELISDIDIINKAKRIIGEDTKYTKIVGDGVTFYILTQEGEVYFVTEDDNGNHELIGKKLNLQNRGLLKEYDSGKSIDILYKIEVKDIVDIYDTCTALTKDGKIISLIKGNTEDISKVQEIEKQTDKYLVASHLGLKDGKLYNFDNIKEGVEVGTYNDVPIPEFIDIVEYRDTYLTRLDYPSNNGGRVNYEYPDMETKCYALTSDGEVWTYIHNYDYSYVIDTGMNLDYFGPTLNYNLDKTNWTNQDVNLEVTYNTTNDIQNVEVKKGETSIPQDNINEDGVKLESNGLYTLKIADGKSREYSTKFEVNNIDKIQPRITSTGMIKSGVLTLEAYDQEDESGNYAKSGIATIEVTDEEPTDETQWQYTTIDIDENGIATAKILNFQENQTIYVRTIDNAGNISATKAIVGVEEPEPVQEEKYTVKFVDYDEAILSEQTVEKGQDAVAPEDPTREAYTFTGWDKDYRNVQDNLIITAQYEKNPEPVQEEKYTVIFMDYDGRTLSKQIVEKGQDAVAPENPTRTDYTFTGWDKDYKNVQTNLIITAQYKKNPDNLAKIVLPKTGKDWLIIIILMILTAGGSSIVAFRKWKK